MVTPPPPPPTPTLGEDLSSVEPTCDSTSAPAAEDDEEDDDDRENDVNDETLFVVFPTLLFEATASFAACANSSLNSAAADAIPPTPAPTLA